MKTIRPSALDVSEFHSYFLGAVAPRPIAFVSTVDARGQVNLSPFSCFNTFGSNPPILIFSATRRVRDNTTKDTLDNVIEHPEAVINIVSYDMAEQMSLASTEYPKGVNEFEKSGLNELPSEVVKPPRVKEAKVSFECKVNQVMPMGTEGGAGNLIICEVLLMHIQESILDANGKIDPFKLDAVGRLGGDWYVRASGSSLFEIEKPNRNMGIGVDQLPLAIRHSDILTGNDLGKLANVASLPDEASIRSYADDPEVNAILVSGDTAQRQRALHLKAREFLSNGEIKKAWLTLLQS